MIWTQHSTVHNIWNIIYNIVSQWRHPWHGERAEVSRIEATGSRSCLCPCPHEMKGCQSHLSSRDGWVSCSVPLCLRGSHYKHKICSHLGWWNESQNCAVEGRRTQAVSEVGTWCHLLYRCCRAERPGQAQCTQRPLWSKGGIQMQRCFINMAAKILSNQTVVVKGNRPAGGAVMWLHCS